MILEFNFVVGTRRETIPTDRMLKEAFGDDYYEKGLQVDSQSPLIGCGSAAQVYKGHLVSSKSGPSTPVAVKVLHPRFQERIERDLWLIETIVKYIHALPVEMIRMINLPRATELFATSLLQQADLQLECEKHSLGNACTLT